MNVSNVEIKTKNLLLKSMALDYAKDMFKEFTPEITLYMFPKSPEKIEETMEFINDAILKNKSGKELQITIFDRKTGEFLGNGGLHDIDGETPELGIWIKKTAHGNGYGKEAMVALKEWADDNIDYKYILYPVVDINHASRKIPESMGAKVEREYDKKNMAGKTWHFVEYRIYPVK